MLNRHMKNMATDSIAHHLATMPSPHLHPTTGQPRKMIRRKALHQRVPLSERTIYNMEKRGEFPLRIALTSRAVAWYEDEIDQWEAGRKDAKAERPGPKQGTAETA